MKKSSNRTLNSANSLFREALSRFASGVTVVTAKQGADKVGITIGSFTSLSLHPAQILFCLDERASCLKAFKRGAPFNVHVLSRRQKHLAQLFASARKRDWKEVDHALDDRQVPLLSNCLATLTCHVETWHKGGDHRIIIGAVERIALSEKKQPPLLYHERDYHTARRIK